MLLPLYSCRCVIRQDADVFSFFERVADIRRRYADVAAIAPLRCLPSLRCLIAFPPCHFAASPLSMPATAVMSPPITPPPFADTPGDAATLLCADMPMPALCRCPVDADADARAFAMLAGVAAAADVLPPDYFSSAFTARLLPLFFA